MHHQRRKSGNTSGNSSAADLRKLTVTADSKHKRPNMARRHTSSTSHKLGRSYREKSDSWDHDEGESFPQYCMTCEKQFLPQNEMLYCSESCRRVDQNSSSSQSTSVRSYTSMHCNYSQFALDKHEPRDIVPRASPSRPTSMHFSNSPPASPGSIFPQQQQHTSAIAALRSLNVRPPSPPSPTGSSSIWPFSRSVATSPSTSSYNSYPRSSASGFFSGREATEGSSGGTSQASSSRYPNSSSRHKGL